MTPAAQKASSGLMRGSRDDEPDHFPPAMEPRRRHGPQIEHIRTATIMRIVPVIPASLGKPDS
jgi:hypothetical protein